MIEEINRKKPSEKQISYFGSHFLKNIEIFGDYRQLCPEGRLHMRLIALLAASMVCLSLSAWAVGF